MQSLQFCNIGFPTTEYLFGPLQQDMGKESVLHSIDIESHFHNSTELFRYRFSIAFSQPARIISDSLQRDDDAVPISRQEIERRRKIETVQTEAMLSDLKNLSSPCEKLSRVYQYFVTVSMQAYGAKMGAMLGLNVTYQNPGSQQKEQRKLTLDLIKNQCLI